MQIGSLTKQFTAAAVLKLVEQGEISLDGHIQRYLADFDTQGHEVAMRHLLNHTSGIRSYTAIFEDDVVPREAVLDTIQKHPFDFAPGEQYAYNNSGYYLLGVIIEAVTGVSYAEHMQETVFEPLGLEATRYCGYGAAPVPVGHVATGSRLEPAALEDISYPGAAGGLCSTAGDLLDWQEALVSGRVMTPDAYRMMVTPTVLGTGDTIGYGFGLGIGSFDDHAAVYHGGGIPGFNAYLAYYPEDRLGVAVVANTTSTPVGEIEEAVARAALDMPRLVEVDVTLTAEQRIRYLGTYDLGRLRFRVFEQDGEVMAEPTGQRVVRLVYQGNDSFRPDITGADIFIEFEVLDGRATSMTLHQGGQVIRAPRVE
jgi:CubicO group peptidase (beta-lactamase class C family)